MFTINITRYKMKCSLEKRTSLEYCQKSFIKISKPCTECD